MASEILRWKQHTITVASVVAVIGTSHVIDEPIWPLVSAGLVLAFALLIAALRIPRRRGFWWAVIATMPLAWAIAQLPDALDAWVQNGWK